MLVAVTGGYDTVQGRTRQDKEMPQSPVPLNEAVQGGTRPLYLHVPSGTALFRGTGLLGFSLSCLVRPCTVLYPLAYKAVQGDFKEIPESTVHAGIYQPMLVYTSMYQHMPSGLSGTLLSCLVPCCIHLRISKKSLCLKAQYMLVYTSIYQYMLVYTSMYQHIPYRKCKHILTVQTGMYCVVPVYTVLCRYVLVCAGMYQ